MAARAAARSADSAAEALVHEHRDGGRAARAEGGGEGSGVGVGPQVAGRRRAALDLGDRAQARAAEGVGEVHAASGDGDAPAREKTISASSRIAAAPESMASRAIS